MYCYYMTGLCLRNKRNRKYYSDYVNIIHFNVILVIMKCNNIKQHNYFIYRFF